MRLLALLLFSAVLTSQDADVVAMNDADRDRTKAAYERLAVALKELGAVHDDNLDKYIIVPCILDQTHKNPLASNPAGAPGKNKCYLIGYESGSFRYSRDFSHILPDTKPLADGPHNCWGVRAK